MADRVKVTLIKSTIGAVLRTRRLLRLLVLLS